MRASLTLQPSFVGGLPSLQLTPDQLPMASYTKMSFLPHLDISGHAQVTPYASDELVLIVPRHHELAKRSSIAVGELQSLSLVSLNQVHTAGTLTCSAAL